jgi:GTP-binding protein
MVDELLKQSGMLRAGGVAVERMMDSNDQERERGITILSKNTAILHGDMVLNIVDTPGHADFSSEVERVLRMVDAVRLLVDAAEGPMPQTRFVLRKSLELGHKVLVCINKIDRKDARVDEVLEEIFDLFVALEAKDHQLDFPHVYAAARDGYAIKNMEDERKDLEPLFDMIIEHVPAPDADVDAPLQLQVATLAFDQFMGRIAIGRIYRGRIQRGMQAVVCTPGRKGETFRVSKLMRFRGLDRIDTDSADAGDIVALAGAGGATVGDTLCPANQPDPLPTIAIDEPTMSMTFMTNTSPFAGSEGKYVTSRQIRERLDRELIANVGLRIEPGRTADSFIVNGRGTLHLSVLIESMRREGYELAISQPQVIMRQVGDQLHEPYEDLSVECAEEHSGSVIDKLNQRGCDLIDLKVDQEGMSRMRWIAPSRGLIGYRSEFLTDTRGTGTLVHRFSHYGPMKTRKRQRGNGVIICQDDCTTAGYGLFGLQERGDLYVHPVQKVYHGQIIGLHSRENDLVVNPAKGKKLTNVRASGTDDAIRLIPPRQFSLEEALEFIEPDELVEVTPVAIRLRKRVLDHNARKRDDKVKG